MFRSEDAPEGASVLLSDCGMPADCEALLDCEARLDCDVLLEVEFDGANVMEREVDDETVAGFELRAFSLYMSPLLIFQSLNRRERQLFDSGSGSRTLASKV